MITPAVFFSFISLCHALCGAGVRWSHHVNIEDVFGMWYGVGYAQHTPDRTNRADDIGCVTLYITEADIFHEDWLHWTLPRRSYSKPRWMSNRNNPWSDTLLSGSWLDVRLKRHLETTHKDQKNPVRDKRDMYEDRRLSVVWDEDGQSVEQVYVYSPDEPGLWTAENYNPLERELKSKGVDIWYPDDPPRHPDVIRLLRVTPEMLLINHCSDSGGIFSLILHRSPIPVEYWQWYELQKQFYDYDLPNVYRKAAVCAACWPVTSEFCLLYGVLLLILNNL